MIAFEYIYNRKLPIIYTSPAICEYDFSGTGTPSIYLEPIYRVGAPTGLVWGGEGGFTLFWGAVPGALCYSVYKSIDADDPYGPYALVAECISTTFWEATDTNQWYRIEVITDDGVSELSDPIFLPATGGDPGGTGPPPPEPPEPPGCGDGVPAVPPSMLRELDPYELVAETVAVPGWPLVSTSFTIEAGQFAAQYMGGYTWAKCPAFNDALVSQFRYQWGTPAESFLMGKQYGCGLGAVGDPPDCGLEAQVWADYPDGVILENPTLPTLVIISPGDSRIGDTAEWVGGVCSNCTGACDPNDGHGGSQTMRLIKVKEFIPQPTFLTISNFNSIKNSVFCVDGPVGGTEWSGVINDFFFQTTSDMQLAETNNGEWVGNMNVAWVEVRYIAGSKWTLTISAYRDGSDFETVFYGEKRYGETGIGNYGKVSGCSGENCVTLV
jgi:hypothetical protein